MTLKNDILAWDGKSAAQIEAVYRARCEQRGFIRALIALADDRACHSGLTWLLKHHVEKTGYTPSAGQVRALLALATATTFWQARLHVLQMIDALSFDDGDVDDALRLASDCTEADEIFVRAWAYYGLAALAATYPQHRTAVRARLELAMTRENRASAKVRLRKALDLINAAPATP